MPIRKNQSNCVITNKLDTCDINQTLSYLKDSFIRSMTLNLCRRRHNT